MLLLLDLQQDFHGENTCLRSAAFLWDCEGSLEKEMVVRLLIINLCCWCVFNLSYLREISVTLSNQGDTRNKL